jgi:hypothetical protein
MEPSEAGKSSMVALTTVIGGTEEVPDPGCWWRKEAAEAADSRTAYRRMIQEVTHEHC